MTCANFMTSIWANKMMPPSKDDKKVIDKMCRVMFYIHSLESVVWPGDPNPNCKYCSDHAVLKAENMELR